MASDVSTAVTKKLWDGKIPASFELAALEVNSSSAPGLLYVMLPRNAYLTMFADKIQEYFRSCMDLSKTDELWFEFNGKPLRWHYPCGVLFDLLCEKTDLPWSITIHFQNFPDKVLIRCPCDEAIESHFMTVLKEADQLKHKGSIISNMSKNQHKQLWHGLKTDSFNEFWSINKKFMDGHEGSDGFKYFPIRIYFLNRVVQKLFASSTENGILTLGKVMAETLPDIFGSNDTTKYAEVVIHGVLPPLSTPVRWLSSNLSYADNFLHICVRA